MSAKILQVTYACTLSAEEFETTIATDASDLAQFPGLRWKIWVVDEERGIFGGIHLFEDQASIDAYLSQVINEFKKHPAVSDVTARTFDVLEAPSLVTRAPIQHNVPA